MRWEKVMRTDARCRELADRHYSRVTIGSPHFTPPGRALVMYAQSETGEAYWVTSWPYPQYVNRVYPDAWMCTAFRNEGAGIASELIREAVAATRAYYGKAPSDGMITLIDRRKVKPTIIHGKPAWGRTYKLAGFKEVGETKGGLMILQLSEADMPEPEMPNGIITINANLDGQIDLFNDSAI